MVTMAGKSRHVLRVLADLTTVLLLVRCNTATGGMRALLCSGHTSSPALAGLYSKQDSLAIDDAELLGSVFHDRDILPIIFQGLGSDISLSAEVYARFSE
jgi:hypothetical protein